MTSEPGHPSAAGGIDTEQAHWKVIGMDCPSCADGLRAGVEALDGVATVSVHFASATITVTYDPLRTDREQIVARVRAAGFEVELPPDAAGGRARVRARPNRRFLAAAASGALLLAALVCDWLGPAGSRWHISLYLAATAAGGFYVARAALLAAVGRRIDMNVLMTAAVIGALAIGYWSEAATVTFLFALSLWLEERAMDRARHAIRSLLKLKPDRVRVLDEHGHESVVDPDRVAVGARMQVRAGERIGLDGTVEAGQGSVDQSAVTGESMPAAKAPGDDVLAGSINLEATLTVRVTRPAGESTISRIIRLVEQAQAGRAPAQRFVDTFARIYTPLVVAAAVLVAAGPPLLLGQPFLERVGEHGWLYRALVLLVTACPCALVISTPVAVVSALAAAARRGVLVKGGVHLETLARVHCIVFDKTGTLTTGHPVVTDVVPSDATSPDELLRIAAALECYSAHHVAHALRSRAREAGVAWPEPADVRLLPGLGLAGTVDAAECWIGSQRLARDRGADTAAIAARLAELESAGKTVVLVGRSVAGNGAGEILGLIAVADEVRPGAREAVRSLRQSSRTLRGRGGARVDVAEDAEPHRAHLVMLTGDNRATAAAVAGRLELDSYAAELMPAEKVTQVRRLAFDCTGAVAMVGDGINDAPALAAADVGVAMGTAGSDAALATADVALIGDDLAGLPFAIRLGRRTRAVIGQNIGVALAVKAAVLVLAVAGVANLWMAVAADMGSSLLVTANGLRLLWNKSVISPR